MDSATPPSNPNDWTDEQWLDWLMATDGALVDESEGSDSLVVTRIAQSIPGQVIGQAMLGMAQAIFGRQDDEIVIVVGANGETTDDEPFAVRLDFNNPERSLVEFKRDAGSAT
jgi:proline dehydrogenase